MKIFLVTLLHWVVCKGKSVLFEIAGVALGVWGQFLIAHRNVLGFWVWIVSNVALVVVSLSNGLYAMAALYVFYSGMCIYSIRQWKKPIVVGDGI